MTSSARRTQRAVACGMLGIGSLLSFPADAVAAPRDEGSITLAAAIEAGSRLAPTVREADQARAAAGSFARDPGSTLPSLPQLTVLAGVRRPRGLPAGPELMATAQQEIATRSLGATRREAAEASVRTAEAELARARLEGGANAALAWIALREAHELKTLRLAAAGDAERLLRVASSRVSLGTATATARSLAEAEVGAARLGLLEAEGWMTEARIALAHAIGKPLDAALDAEGELEVSAAPPALPPHGPRPEDHPTLRAAEGRVAQLVSEGRATHASLGPTFSLGASAWREGSGDHAIAAVVSVPLPFFDPARYDTGKHALAEAAARAHASRIRFDLQRERTVAEHERRHTREIETEVRTGLVAPLIAAQTTALVAYEAGTTELSVVLIARRTSLAAQERLVIALADVRRAGVRADALEGTLLSKGLR